MIGIIYFQKPIGGMHDYAELINEGYKLINKKTIICSYFGGKYDYITQTIKLLIGVKSNTMNWYFENKLDDCKILHFTDTALFTGLFLKKIYNINKSFIITIHDPNLHPRKGFIGKTTYILAYLLNRQLIKIAEKRKNVYIHLHSHREISNKKVNYIFSKHPISNKYSNYDRITKLKKGESISFLFIGSLHHYKGVDIFIDSIKNYKRNYNDKCSFTIAGQGSASIPSEIQNDVDFINRFLSPKEFVSLIKNAHVLVFPYRQATQSGVLNLALSLNKPVIINNVGNLKDYVQNNITGVVLNDCSEISLVNSYIQFIKFPDLLFNMSKNALNFKEQFYSFEIAQKIINQLDNKN